MRFAIAFIVSVVSLCCTNLPAADSHPLTGVKSVLVQLIIISDLEGVDAATLSAPLFENIRMKLQAVGIDAVEHVKGSTLIADANLKVAIVLPDISAQVENLELYHCEVRMSISQMGKFQNGAMAFADTFNVSRSAVGGKSTIATRMGICYRACCDEFLKSWKQHNLAQ